MRDLNKLAAKIHNWNKKVGWWDRDPETGALPCPYAKIQLINTEVSEATEGLRKDLMDTHLPERKMEEVEFADALIRTLDFGAAKKLSIRMGEIEKGIEIAERTIRHYTPARMHLFLTTLICSMAHEFEGVEERGQQDRYLNHAYEMLVAAIIAAARLRKFGLFAALDEKMAYNKVRADHKRETRAAAGGKKL